MHVRESLDFHARTMGRKMDVTSIQMCTQEDEWTAAETDPIFLGKT